MDKALLLQQGIAVGDISPGYVEGFTLHIGERATLLPFINGRVYGLVMDLYPDDVKKLYSEPSVADYVSESVTVFLSDTDSIEAVCFNLPADKISGTNKAYAKSLYGLAHRLGFPEHYLDQIKRSVT